MKNNNDHVPSRPSAQTPFGNLFNTTSMSSSTSSNGNNNQGVISNHSNNNSNHQQRNSFSTTQHIHQTHTATPANLFSTVFSQTALNNVNSFVEDENQLNRQFVQSANSIAQLYTMSLQSYRKSYQQGVRKAIRRISTMLLQHCNLHHQHTPLNTPTSNIQIPVETILGFLNQVLQEELTSANQHNSSSHNSSNSGSNTTPSTSASQHHHGSYSNNLANNSNSMSSMQQHHQQNISLNVNSTETPLNDVSTIAETDSMIITTNSDHTHVGDTPSVSALDGINSGSSSGNNPDIGSTHKLSPLSNDANSPTKMRQNTCDGVSMSAATSSFVTTSMHINSSTNTQGNDSNSHNTNIPSHPFSFPFQFSSASSQPMITNPSTSSSFNLNFPSDFSFASALMSGSVSTTMQQNRHHRSNGNLHHHHHNSRYHYTLPTTHNTSLKRSVDEFLGLISNVCQDDDEEDDIPTFLFRTVNTTSNDQITTTTDPMNRSENSNLRNLSNLEHCNHISTSANHSFDLSTAADISQELSPLTQIFKKNRI
ncbi:hypothetical protein C9374_000691 [Naegleria lovaniensis]|uniref:Uncharacterized protein n=1 Tax=Naegleria lovaniensis TaxID=51637 RepID=A0AA88KTA1_NAELO|nr:uncharacterized protein C9374_000691 [Naegleria lovaniensis]KAG2388527.1 hypothetical protein C9374_000691 [Naegleria lovaniensis]